MKKNYEKPTCEIIPIEYEGGFLTSSVETINKDFKVKTGDYEVENDWISSESTFNTGF